MDRAHRLRTGRFLDLGFLCAQQCFLRPGPWQKSASYQAQRMMDEGGAGGRAVGALFPKCHSHDSLTSESFPFLLSFSPSLPSALLRFPFSIPFLNPHKALRGLELPWGLLPLVRLVSRARTTVLGPSALEGHREALGAW